MKIINKTIHGTRKIINKTTEFFNDTVLELKKCTWPTQTELFESTLVVIISVAILGVFVATCDGVLTKLLKVLIG